MLGHVRLVAHIVDHEHRPSVHDRHDAVRAIVYELADEHRAQLGRLRQPHAAGRANEPRIGPREYARIGEPEPL